MIVPPVKSINPALVIVVLVIIVTTMIYLGFARKQVKGPNPHPSYHVQ
jgi:hypothetical protein